jgi:hypothetical protein
LSALLRPSDFRPRSETLGIGLQRHFEQTPDLLRGQMAKASLRKIAEREGPGPDPLELDHGPPHVVEHAPDLPLPSFVDRDLQPRVHFLFADFFYLCRRGLPVLKKHSLFEQFYHPIIKHALDLRQIGFRELVLRVRDQVREVAVVRQEQKAFGIVIEPSHGIDADLDPFQEVLHRGPSFGI